MPADVAWLASDGTMCVSDTAGHKVIELEKVGTLLVTPAAGPLVRFCNGDNVEIPGGDGIVSANYGCIASLGHALIPTGFDNTVVAITIPETANRLIRIQN